MYIALITISLLPLMSLNRFWIYIYIYAKHITFFSLHRFKETCSIPNDIDGNVNKERFKAKTCSLLPLMPLNKFWLLAN